MMLRPQRKKLLKVFYNKKLRYVNRVRTHAEKCDRHSKDVLEGRFVGASIILKAAYRIVDLGMEGEELVKELNQLRPEKLLEIRKSIAALCCMLESVSSVLEYLIDIRPVLMRNNVKLIHLGRIEGLPQPVLNDLTDTMEETSANTGMILALALNYSGRTEIVDATRKIAQEYKKGKLRLKDINEQCISQNLYASKLADPDLLIRTANEMRISNFLLWQISYSEFYVTKTLWPDFKKTSIEKAIMAYASRKRRFGTI